MIGDDWEEKLYGQDEGWPEDQEHIDPDMDFVSDVPEEFPEGW